MTNETDDTVVQPTLPDLGLPEFEGLMPVDVITSLNGSSSRIRRAVHHGQSLVLVIEANVVDIAHPKTKDGIKRVQKLNVIDLFELEGAQGKRLLSTLRVQYKELDDARHGVLPISAPGADGEVVLYDDDGIALTPDEAAARRGDVLAQAGIETGPDPVVAVLNDATRLMWGQDFDPPMTNEPHVGDRHLDSLIVEILDATTGETLEKLSGKELDKQLLALEQQLEAEEDEEDEANDE